MARWAAIRLAAPQRLSNGHYVRYIIHWEDAILSPTEELGRPLDETNTEVKWGTSVIPTQWHRRCQRVCDLSVFTHIASPYTLSILWCKRERVQIFVEVCHHLAVGVYGGEDSRAQ